MYLQNNTYRMNETQTVRFQRESKKEETIKE